MKIRTKGDEEIHTPFFNESMQIFVKNNNTLHKLNIVDISYIQSDGNYCMIYTRNKKKYAAKISLTKLLSLINQPSFQQVHRGFVVQVKLIESIDSSNNKITMEDGSEIPIGRKFKDDFLDSITIL